MTTSYYIWYWHGRRDRAAGMPNTVHIVPVNYQATYSKGWNDGADDQPRREVPQ